MNYNLNDLTGAQQKASTWQVLKKLVLLIREERTRLLMAFGAILVNSILNLLNPFIIGYTIDRYIMHKDFHGVLTNAALLVSMAFCAFGASYLQTRLMGGVGQRMLFKLRNTVFTKLQELPIAFFNQNKAGDLISRVNNDTDKINQFFSQSLMQFIGTLVTMTGAGIFLLLINPRLGLATLVPGALILLFTRLASPWVRKKNAASLRTTGGLSAEIQESLNNFKVIIAFNRRDYFRQRFEEVNTQNYKAAREAGVANNLFIPVYGFFASIAQLIVLTVGIYLISEGKFSIGLLVSYLAYSNNFYNPLRQLAALWTNFQVAMAATDRISHILGMESNLPVIETGPTASEDYLMEFRDVQFDYGDGRSILRNINFKLETGKTYALVGPTGGGKTTTASLIARLYDPVKGLVCLHGKDIKSYPASARTREIGFILQEPFLFSGTVGENIISGNDLYFGYSPEQLNQVIREAGLDKLLAVFENGLETKITTAGDSISLGQKQLIAFMRAVLRQPQLLVLDEATANIDTITEQILQEILDKLPPVTTKVIIAHRLNTIRNADEIFFINSGELVPAGSFDNALHMLLQEKRTG